MGKQFPGSGFMFLRTKHLLSLDRALIHSQKRLCEIEKGGPCWTLVGGAGGFCLHSGTGLAATPYYSGAVFTKPLWWSMRFSSVSMASRYLEYQSRYPTSYPSRTFWYLVGSRCWTEIWFTNGVGKSWPPICTVREGSKFPKVVSRILGWPLW